MKFSNSENNIVGCMQALGGHFLYYGLQKDATNLHDGLQKFTM